MEIKGVMECRRCGFEFNRTSWNQRYCSKCSRIMSNIKQVEQRERNKERQKAKKAMAGIETGVLDKRLEECRKRGIDYSELKKEKALEQAGKIVI